MVSIPRTATKYFLKINIGSGVIWGNGWFLNITGANNSHKFDVRKWAGSIYSFNYQRNTSSDLNSLSLIRIIISGAGVYAYSLVNNLYHNYGPGPSLPSTGNFWIGYQNLHNLPGVWSEQFFNGEISEIIYFRRNLNDSERSKVKEYFKEKYKLKF